MRKTAVIVGIALSVVLAVVALASSRHITMVVSQDMEFFLPSSSLFQMESPHREDSSANVTDEITYGLNETVGGVEENDESAKAVVEVTPINRLGIPRKKLEFLHIGKAGGGTIAMRIRQAWKLQIHQCHPWPCVNKAWNDPDKNHPWIIISLRDPVDRFVSAFYWRILVHCHPEVDKRPPGRPPQMQKCQTDRFPGLSNETIALFYRYNQSASMLAEDLCSGNETSARIARESLGTILHGQHNIDDWLDFKWEGNRIFPVVVERGAQDLEEQIDMSIHWLHNVTSFQPDDGFARRAAVAKTKSQTKNEHSSDTAKKSLSLEGEKCLERFYRRDYQILKELLDTACKTPGCRQAIGNILQRRQRAFEGPPVAITKVPIPVYK